MPSAFEAVYGGQRMQLIAPGEPTRPPAHAGIWITSVSSDRQRLAIQERHWRRSRLTREIRLQRG